MIYTRNCIYCFDYRTISFELRKAKFNIKKHKNRKRTINHIFEKYEKVLTVYYYAG